MKLGIWSSYYHDLSPEDMILEFARHGITNVEMSDEHAAVLLDRGGDAGETGRKLREFANEHGVSFPQGHLWLRCSICGDLEVLNQLKYWLDLFIGLGITSAVLHCDWNSFPPGTTRKEAIEVNAQRLKILTGHIAGSNLTICLENLFGSFGTNFYTAGDLLEVIKAAGEDHLGICLDTGHLNLTTKDQVAFIQEAGNKLKALHIADNEGESDQHLMPFTRGNVDFAGVVRELRVVGYDRLFNYEIPGESRCPLELRGEKLSFIRAGYDYLMRQD